MCDREKKNAFLILSTYLNPFSPGVKGVRQGPAAARRPCPCPFPSFAHMWSKALA